MCFIYINDIPEGIKSISKILADDTSLFSIVKWAHQWKMLFNHDSRKKATEVYFSRRLNQDSLPLDFNDNTFEIVEIIKIDVIKPIFIELAMTNYSLNVCMVKPNIQMNV